MSQQLQIEDLQYDYPKELVATEPREPCRVLLAPEDDILQEVSLKQLQSVFKNGDLLVINNSGVKLCRIFYENKEILFLHSSEGLIWDVLFVSRGMKEGESFDLPGGVEATLIQKGRPHKLKLNKELPADYFTQYGEPALPPYIQKLRESRKPLSQDRKWYQTDWHKDEKSLAAPTASLHFSNEDLENLKQKGIQIAEVTLHVGLGTFLPLVDENITEQKLHEETIMVSEETIKALKHTKAQGGRVWALGTTALRAIESVELSETDSVFKKTDLFIMPGYKFKWVSGLLTNFHQPGSSLLALVMAFSGREKTLQVYKSAVEKKFRLFSYGDLSVWTRTKP